MSFADWVNNGWLVAHKSSRQEIGNLLGIVARDLKDSQAKDVPDDWRDAEPLDALKDLERVEGRQSSGMCNDGTQLQNQNQRGHDTAFINHKLRKPKSPVRRTVALAANPKRVRTRPFSTKEGNKIRPTALHAYEQGG